MYLYIYMNIYTNNILIFLQFDALKLRCPFCQNSYFCKNCISKYLYRLHFYMHIITEHAKFNVM